MTALQNLWRWAKAIFITDEFNAFMEEHDMRQRQTIEEVARKEFDYNFQDEEE